LAPLARALHANPRSWYFVTGAPDELARVAGAFHLAAGHADPLFTLVDQSGHVRGQYDPRNQNEEDALVSSLGLLVNNY
jgi:hypothetical protein